MNLRIDRDLPVPIGVQLRGLVEYGIACGELARGSRLPSVRDLARRLEVAPMTVSQVYKDLKASGLLAMRPGQGTFVAAADPGQVEDDRLSRLRPAVDRLISEAQAAGVGHQDLAGLLNARLLAATRRERPLRLVMLGLFADATRDYAQIPAGPPAGGRAGGAPSCSRAWRRCRPPAGGSPRPTSSSPSPTSGHGWPAFSPARRWRS